MSQARGYREVTIQNIVFKTDTVLYRLERLYSTSTGQLYEAQLPVGVRGKSYGKELEAFTRVLYYQLRVPQEKILALVAVPGHCDFGGENFEIAYSAIQGGVHN